MPAARRGITHDQIEHALALLDRGRIIELESIRLQVRADREAQRALLGPQRWLTGTRRCLGCTTYIAFEDDLFVANCALGLGGLVVGRSKAGLIRDIASGRAGLEGRLRFRPSGCKALIYTPVECRPWTPFPSIKRRHSRTGKAQPRRH